MIFTEDEIVNSLEELYGEAWCELHFEDNYQLLVAVILSAQCTDKRVNIITPQLFSFYPTVFDMAQAKQEEVEKVIRSCGFYHNKAKNIISACNDIVRTYNGEVPSTMEELTALSGVGRKTANVVLSNAFSQSAIAVDTHVFRVSNRLGIAQANNPHQCEKQLQHFFSRKNWSNMHHSLVLFGRYVCKARKPECVNCPFVEKCPSKMTLK